jgi:4-aminobutyrate--pyruvate transaminase
VGEVRGVGLVAAVELVADKATRRNFDASLKIGARAAKLAEAQGVISRGLPGDALAFSPPLIITEADVRDMIDRVGKAVDELAVQLRRENISLVR